MRIEQPLSPRGELQSKVDDLNLSTEQAKQERDRLGALMELNELEVSDVMVHRTDMRSVNADSPTETIVREIIQSPHTRMPLWQGSLDNIVGVVHAKDLARMLSEAGNDVSQVDLMKIACKALVRARYDAAARPA